MCLAQMPKTATGNCSPSSSELEHLHLNHAWPGIFLKKRKMTLCVARQPGARELRRTRGFPESQQEGSLSSPQSSPCAALASFHQIQK